MPILLTLGISHQEVVQAEADLGKGLKTQGLLLFQRHNMHACGTTLLCTVEKAVALVSRAVYCLLTLLTCHCLPKTHCTYILPA